MRNKITIKFPAASGGELHLIRFFSIIIPTLNRKPQLKRMLNTLMQDEYHQKEIIVCDSASTDGTVDLLKSYGSRVRWISEPDKGEYDGRNKRLQLATGKIIKYMSDNDALLSGSLSYAVKVSLL